MKQISITLIVGPYNSTTLLGITQKLSSMHGFLELELTRLPPSSTVIKPTPELQWEISLKALTDSPSSSIAQFQDILSDVISWEWTVDQLSVTKSTSS